MGRLPIVFHNLLISIIKILQWTETKVKAAPAGFLHVGISDIVIIITAKDMGVVLKVGRVMLYFKNNRSFRTLIGSSSEELSGLYAAVWRPLFICFLAGCLGILVNAVSTRGIPLFGPVPSPVIEGIEEVGLEAARALYREGEGTFVDARSEQEFRVGHIPGALLLSKDTFEETIVPWKALVPPDTVLITYCAGAGCESSSELAALLMEEGYTQVKVFFGGWKQWFEAGYPVETMVSEGNGSE